MIRCNLAVLLAERNLKITKVASDTGVSRTTLTSLANNYSQGIQFDTLNTLCMYLKTTPEMFIAYIPVDIKINHISVTDELLEIDLLITEKGRRIKCGLCGDVHTHFTNGVLQAIDITVNLWDAWQDTDIQKENSVIVKAFKQLPQTFLSDLESKICSDILSSFDSEDESPIDLTFNWSKELFADNPPHRIGFTVDPGQE